MEALDYGQLNVQTYVCYPTMCDDSFITSLQTALLEYTCSMYLTEPCEIQSVDCSMCNFAH
jgi:hypothetical protein